MKYRKTAALVVASVTGLVVTLTNTTGASAASGDVYAETTDAGSPKAYARWASYGEHLTVCDNARDGLGAIAYVEVAPYWERVLTIRDTTGAGGACAHAPTSFDLAENRSIRVKVCVERNAGRDQYCSAWRGGSA